MMILELHKQGLSVSAIAERRLKRVESRALA